MDLGLTQGRVAQELGLTAWTVLNWELGKTRPGARHLGRLTRFLGYLPVTAGHSLPEQILETRRRMGLTQRELAALVGVREAAIRNWERGRRRPRGERLRALKAYVDRAINDGAPRDSADR